MSKIEIVLQSSASLLLLYYGVTSIAFPGRMQARILSWKSTRFNPFGGWIRSDSYPAHLRMMGCVCVLMGVYLLWDLVSELIMR
jgi:hypothetical protein